MRWQDALLSADSNVSDDKMRYLVQMLSFKRRKRCSLDQIEGNLRPFLQVLICSLCAGIVCTRMWCTHARCPWRLMTRLKRSPRRSWRMVGKPPSSFPLSHKTSMLTGVSKFHARLHGHVCTAIQRGRSGDSDSSDPEGCLARLFDDTRTLGRYCGSLVCYSCWCIRERLCVCRHAKRPERMKTLQIWICRTLAVTFSFDYWRKGVLAFALSFFQKDVLSFALPSSVERDAVAVQSHAWEEMMWLQ